MDYLPAAVWDHNRTHYSRITRTAAAWFAVLPARYTTAHTRTYHLHILYPLLTTHTYTHHAHPYYAHLPLPTFPHLRRATTTRGLRTCRYATTPRSPSPPAGRLRSTPHTTTYRFCLSNWYTYRARTPARALPRLYHRTFLDIISCNGGATATRDDGDR